MKQTKVKFLANKADSFAAYCYNNKIETVLSWSKEEGFFETYIYCIIAIPETFTDSFRSGEFFKNIVN